LKKSLEAASSGSGEKRPGKSKVRRLLPARKAS